MNWNFCQSWLRVDGYWLLCQETIGKWNMRCSTKWVINIRIAKKKDALFFFKDFMATTVLFLSLSYHQYWQIILLLLSKERNKKKKKRKKQTGLPNKYNNKNFKRYFLKCQEIKMIFKTFFLMISFQVVYNTSIQDLMSLLIQKLLQMCYWSIFASPLTYTEITPNHTVK